MTMDWGDIFDVGTWPKPYRVAFVLTLPISGPLYLLACAAFVVGLLATIVGCGLACGLVYLWEGKSAWNQASGRGEGR